MSVVPLTVKKPWSDWEAYAPQVTTTLYQEKALLFRGGLKKINYPKLIILNKLS